MTYDLQIGEKNLSPSNHEITLYVNDVKKYKTSQKKFENILEHLLNESIRINFKKRNKNQNKIMSSLIPENYDYLSLFSGGLDSITIPFLANYSEKKGVLHHSITHKNPQGKAIEVFENHFKPTKRQILVTSTSTNKAEKPGYLKTRGLIFLTNGLCVASELSIPEVIIPENGPFMINYPVSASTDPTRTTDPHMIESWTKIFNHITNSDIKISTPFKNMTKSEVILSSRNRKLIQDTWSCSYFQGLTHMCGMCNSCLVRILSCYAIDEGEDIDQVYKKNPFTIDPSSLSSIEQRKYFISKDTATFCRSILEPNTLNNVEKERFSSLQERYPLLCNYALDLMLGFQKLSCQCSSTQSLFTHFKKMLDHIDLDLIKNRNLQLMQQRLDLGYK